MNGCGMLGNSLSAFDACAGPARDYGGPVVGAFDTSVGAVRRLQGDGQPLLWQEHPATDPAVLCYVDAEIPKAPPPGPNGLVRPSFNRVVIGVIDGAGVMVLAGYRDRLAIKSP